jgi:hypothetical protein
VDTYGRSIGITRQDLINDDIGLLQDIPTVLGAESSRTVSDVLFETLATAPATFFSAGNGNLLTGTESALSVQSLQTAVQALMTMKDADGRVIGLRPRSLVVPAALWGTASGILNSQQLWRDGTSDLQPSGNPAADLNLTLVIEGRLDAYSVTAWYLSADAQAGGMLAAFLNGQQGIFLDQRDQPPEFLGTIYRAYMDFGIALGEHRALIKANGA